LTKPKSGPSTTDEGERDAEGDHCECGQVIRAESESELLDKAEQHVHESHPDLVGTMTREDADRYSAHPFHGLPEAA
jgi:predicted small metal-binding protein